MRTRQQILGLGLLILTACSGPGTGLPGLLANPPSERAEELLAVLADTTPEGSMPLAVLEDLVLRNPDLHDAIELAITACMAGKGFAYQPSPWASELLGDQRFGITDELAAAENGYAIPVADRVLAEGSMQSRPALEREAFFGRGDRATIDEWKGGNSSVDVGGCLEEGADAVLGSFVAWASVYDRVRWLADESARSRDADPRAIAVLAEWVECMENAGYQTTSPVYDPPIDGGVEAAVTDASCHASSGLTEVWTAVEVEVQWDLLADHADALAGLIAETTIPLTP